MVEKMVEFMKVNESNRGSKMVSCIHRFINILFAAFMISVLIATLLLDKNIANPFPNVAKWSNGGYYLIAFTVIGAMLWLYIHKKNKFSTKYFYIMIGCIAIVTMLLQTIIVIWAPESLGNGDFGNVKQMAISLAQGGRFLEKSYFSAASNNVHIAILLSWVYRLTSSWRGVIWLGAILTNISIVLATLIVFRLTQHMYPSVIICVIGEILTALSWRAYMPYTDNWGMFFAIAVIYLYVSDIKEEYKILSIIVVGLIGAWIKITALIPLIGISIYSVFSLLCAKKTSRKKLQIIIWTFVLTIGIGGGGTYASRKLSENYGYVKTDSAKGWQYFFMVGQDESCIGTVGVGSSAYYEKWKEITTLYTKRNERM